MNQKSSLRKILQFVSQALTANTQEQPQLNCGSLSKISYYIGREGIIPAARIPGMWVWREGLFAFMLHNAERSAAYFCIPAAQVVEIGIEIEI
jgi:KUP system potassium uptake protein